MSTRTIVIVAGIVLLLAGTCLLLLLPRQITLSQSIAVKAPSNAVVRSLTERDKWVKWWPREQTGLLYREQNFGTGPQLSNSLLVDIPMDDSVVASLLMAIGVSRDSTIVSWTAPLRGGSNPLHRISTWLEARRLKKQFSQVLSRLKDFAEDPQNVYGLPVKEVKVTTPYLVATRAGSPGYPSTREVYALVDQLRAYVHSEGARETAPPMLNVLPRDSSTYEFMVALPVDRLLPGRGDIKQKRMVLGKILQAEVRGGDHTVRRGMAALENYMRDYGRRSPAIPYASLTTDRTRERDTAKWITHLYYPVF